MRGLIFTELYELIEDKFGFEMLDNIIVDSGVPNDGAYTATGNYPFSELLALVVQLHKKSELPIETLLEVFGEQLFKKLISAHPQFDEKMNVLDFLENVELYIHHEVQKLYPDAELPKFDIVSKDEKSFVFYYNSSKQLHHLAKGLILGASKHFSNPVTIEMIPQEDKRVLFTVSLI